MEALFRGWGSWEKPQRVIQIEGSQNVSKIGLSTLWTRLKMTFSFQKR